MCRRCREALDPGEVCDHCPGVDLAHLDDPREIDNLSFEPRRAAVRNDLLRGTFHGGKYGWYSIFLVGFVDAVCTRVASSPSYVDGSVIFLPVAGAALGLLASLLLRLRRHLTARQRKPGVRRPAIPATLESVDGVVGCASSPAVAALELQQDGLRVVSSAQAEALTVEVEYGTLVLRAGRVRVGEVAEHHIDGDEEDIGRYLHYAARELPHDRVALLYIEPGDRVRVNAQLARETLASEYREQPRSRITTEGMVWVTLLERGSIPPASLE